MSTLENWKPKRKSTTSRKFWRPDTRDIWEKQFGRLTSLLDAATRHSNTIDTESLRMSADIESFIETKVKTKVIIELLHGVVRSSAR